MQKPTPAAVKDLTGSTASDTFVQTLIEDAAMLGGDCLAGIDGSKQETVIKYIAAHLMFLTGDDATGELASKSLGDASKSWNRAPLGKGMYASQYGKIAASLLPCLATLGNPTASIQVML